MSTVRNLEASSDFMGKHLPGVMELAEKDPDKLSNPDMNDPKAIILAAEPIADAIVYCINQPAGVTISDILIRATNESMTF